MHKKTYLRFGIAAFSLILSGCVTTATLIQHPKASITNSKYAPESERRETGIGVVRYLNEGIESIRNARRDDAYKKAYHACDGKYRIIHESSEQTNPTFITTRNDAINTSYTSAVSSQYIFIYFECT